MQITFNQKIAEQYKSPSQKIRVVSENWVDNEIFCPNCGMNVSSYENNRPVADFYCPNCDEEYELKSKKNDIGGKILDGTYHTMIRRLTSKDNPNFFLLSYDLLNSMVTNFFVIPKHFFIPKIIEKRKPLAPTARRAGWIGCNILLNNIPQTGKIFFVRNKLVEPRKKILNEWKKTLFLREEKEISAKGWLIDIMSCIEKLGKEEFTLNDVYMFENELQELHPENRHIKDKIRQQLQILRNKNYLDFIGRGIYHLN